MKRLILLGASGSIGTQTVDIVKEHSDELKIVGVSVGKNKEYLQKLLKEFDIKYAYSIDRDLILEAKYPDTKFFFGEEGILEMLKVEDYDMMVNALVGFVGFKPTLEAIKNHKDVALANKETLIGGGQIINAALKEYNVNLYPIDSEHVAIWQCMQGHTYQDINRLILTASGGAFRDKKREELFNVKPEDALKHPVWNMGAKITIDSATMMNKGFEIIEAHYLFNIPFEKIDVILHDESSVHSMVEYNDGAIIAQLGPTDMHMMIKYALLYPRHKNDNTVSHLELDKIGTLHFRPMDYNRYPLVKLAKQVGGFAGNFGAVLVGANDEAVSLFLKNRIKFVDIETLIFKTLKAAHFIKNPTVDQIIESNKWAREYVDKTWANS